MKQTKKIVFLASFCAIATFFLLGYGVPFLCGVHNYSCQDKFEIIFPMLGIFLPLFLLSLVTYKMHDGVFHAWWHFARWWAPLIIVATLLIENTGIGGRYPGAEGSSLSVYYIYHARFLIYIFLYTIFIITSLVKIVRAYGKK